MTGDPTQETFPSMREMEPAYAKAIGVATDRLTGELTAEITATESGAYAVWVSTRLPKHDAVEGVRVEPDGTIRHAVFRDPADDPAPVWSETVTLDEIGAAGSTGRQSAGADD